MNQISAKREWVSKLRFLYEMGHNCWNPQASTPFYAIVKWQKLSPPKFCYICGFSRYNLQGIWGSHHRWPSKPFRSHDKPWYNSRKWRKGFKRLETFAISDNYFRSIICLPPAPYPENQPSQSALELNSTEYLTLLVTLEVNSILRTLSQQEMYKYGNVLSPPSPQYTAPTDGT